MYLALELDTIENKKQLYKADNNLVDLTTTQPFHRNKVINHKKIFFH